MLVDTRLQVLVLRCFGTGWFPPEVSRFRIRRSPGDDVMDGSRRDMKGRVRLLALDPFLVFVGK